MIRSIRTCFVFLLLPVFYFGCASPQDPAKNALTASDSKRSAFQQMPDWARRGNIYEVNLRQYTTDGTFRAFQSHLARLKKMGVEILWFMPIHPISKKDRKGNLGSYYAVADYYGVNEEFGTPDDFKNLVRTAQREGFKVIIDWVPNHTGADHYWLIHNPEFYFKDEKGNPKFAYDWSDTRELNYDNRAMRDSMKAAMKFWILEAGIDGFRVDVAGEVPIDFWEEAIPELRKIKTIFLLAEGENEALFHAGFDASYPWKVFHTMKDIAAGKAPASQLDSLLVDDEKKYGGRHGRLYFTSNHDENSWAGADHELFPEERHAPFAVLTHSLPRSIPLIYSGQEEPLTRRLEFFEKDPISFSSYQRASFYKNLMELRKRNKALSVDAGWRKIPAGDNRYIFSILRYEGSFKVLVITNLSDTVRTISINDAALNGSPKNIFTNQRERLDLSTSFELEAWGYRVYEY